MVQCKQLRIDWICNFRVQSPHRTETWRSILMAYVMERMVGLESDQVKFKFLKRNHYKIIIGNTPFDILQDSSCFNLPAPISANLCRRWTTIASTIQFSRQMGQIFGIAEEIPLLIVSFQCTQFFKSQPTPIIQKTAGDTWHFQFTRFYRNFEFVRETAIDSC